MAIVTQLDATFCMKKQEVYCFSIEPYQTRGEVDLVYYIKKWYYEQWGEESVFLPSNKNEWKCIALTFYIGGADNALLFKMTWTGEE